MAKITTGPPVLGGAIAKSVSFTPLQIETSTNASTPLPLVAAPGSGTTLFPISFAACYVAGTVPFSADISPGIEWDSLVSILALSSIPTTALTSYVRADLLAPTGSLVADCDGRGLVLAPTGATRVGPLLTATVDLGGSGYAPGDTGTIFNPTGLTGAANAGYHVTTVGGGGAVTAFAITATGANFEAPWNGAGTNVDTGGGDGAFTVDITAVTPRTDGKLNVTVVYESVATA